MDARGYRKPRHRDRNGGRGQAAQARQTKQAMAFMQSMGGMLPQEKPAALKKAARESGYTGACPFADER
jgi:hypothetical protein